MPRTEKMKMPFVPANILLPKRVDNRWPVVACDQFTSQPDYWERVEKLVGDAPSTLRMVLPEIYLSGDVSRRIEEIDKTIDEYLDSGLFEEYRDSLIYVERTLPDGRVRRGIVGAIDLEAYDYRDGSKAAVRATEGTVLSRIPARVEIRKDAAAELPHVMLLADDPRRSVIEPIGEYTGMLKKIYDVPLMLGGGRVKGFLMDDAAIAQVISALEVLQSASGDGFLFAVGDGNHSLAAAKTCYELNPNPLNRYALCEIVNLHDDALEFEPIYRVMFGVDPADVVNSAEKYFKKQNGPTVRIEYVAESICGTLDVPTEASSLPVGCIQPFIDDYIKTHPGTKIDYIHGEDVTRRLGAQPGAIGFIFDGMRKETLFDAVRADGALPRKTFSMGEAASKRYYMEARRISPKK